MIGEPLFLDRTIKYGLQMSELDLCRHGNHRLARAAGLCRAGPSPRFRGKDGRSGPMQKPSPASDCSQFTTDMGLYSRGESYERGSRPALCQCARERARRFSIETIIETASLAKLNGRVRVRVQISLHDGRVNRLQTNVLECQRQFQFTFAEFLTHS